jgi:hypothetical protein
MRDSKGGLETLSSNAIYQAAVSHRAMARSHETVLPWRAGNAAPSDRKMWEKKIKPIFCAFHFLLPHFPV